MRAKLAGVVAVVVVAGAAALWPWPAGWVEERYSRGLYPAIQRVVTRMANAVPFALLDVLIIAAAGAVLVGLFAALHAPQDGRWRALGRLAAHGIVAGSALYVVFLLTWGLNYRRDPIEARLEFDESRVTAESVAALNEAAIGELARLRPLLPEGRDGWPHADAVARGLAGPLAEGARLFGLPGPVAPGRPKRTILNPYFTRAGVSGLTDPFFLETLLPSNLLPFELPSVIAHEWGHLAGFARESEASLFGLAVCLRGDEAAQYSAWLDVFVHTLGARDGEGRRAARGRLPAAVRADLEAMAERSARDQVRSIQRVAWRTYDRYLRSQRVSSGVANYGEVVRLIAGTRFAPGWTPVLRERR